MRFIYLLTTMIVLAGCQDAEQQKFESFLIDQNWQTDSLQDYTHSETVSWIDSDGFPHSQVLYKKSVAILKFYPEKKAVLTIPNLQHHFQMASVLHKHGTSVEDTSAFDYEYKINFEDSTIQLNGGFLNNIDLKYKNGQIWWPLWKSKESIIFFSRKPPRK